METDFNPCRSRRHGTLINQKRKKSPFTLLYPLRLRRVLEGGEATGGHGGGGRAPRRLSGGDRGLPLRRRRRPPVLLGPRGMGPSGLDSSRVFAVLG